MDHIKLQQERNISPIPANIQSLVPDHLLERDRIRQEELSSKRQHFDLPPEEHPDFIAQKFSELAAEVKENINESVKQFLHKPTDLVSLEEGETPQQKFASIAVRISELQRYLTACTRFLPDYKIKACTQIISELNKLLDEARQKVIPKKKFGFSARKTTKKATRIDKNLEGKEKADPSKPIAIDETDASLLASTLGGLNRNHSSRHDEYILEMRENVNKHDVNLVNLENCFVELRGHASSVRADNLKDCIVLMGPVSSSVYVENCKNTIFAIACQQLRCHNSIECRIFLHVTCRAVMEDCQSMEFSDYSYNYAEIGTDFVDAGLDRSINNYADVADFNWLSPHAPSPNWQLMPRDKCLDLESLRVDFQAKLKNKSVMEQS